MNMFKKFVALMLAVVLAACLFESAGDIRAHAAEKLKKPVITDISVIDNGTGVQLVVPNINVDYDVKRSGYTVYMKKNKEKKFKEVIFYEKYRIVSDESVLKVTNLTNGSYQFKIRSYAVVDGKVIYSPYSKVKSVNVAYGDEWFENVEDMAASKWPGLKKLADKGLIGINAPQRDIIKLGKWECEAYPCI
ncbi:MAG: hypothetical protein K6G81_04325, partial [Lachnospiraceae bacterium]|nr:hypothetical protein [Lachnospiraceae bacterium]